MADASDVEAALVTTIGAALYPTGARVGASAIGADVRVYRGWPQADQLDADLAHGIAHVSVRADPGATRNVTRFGRDWKIVSTPMPGLLATMAGETVTFAGPTTLGQTAGVAIGTTKVATGYAYRLQAGDTPASVAAGLAALVPGGTASGAVLTVPGGLIFAGVAADAGAIQELRRVEQLFRIACWCPTPAVRDALVSAVDVAIEELRFLPLPDGSATENPKYRATYLDDVPQKEQMWRRDVVYAIEYPTVAKQSQPTVLFAGMTLNGVIGSGNLYAIPALQ